MVGVAGSVPNSIHAPIQSANAKVVVDGYPVINEKCIISTTKRRGEHSRLFLPFDILLQVLVKRRYINISSIKSWGTSVVCSLR